MACAFAPSRIPAQRLLGEHRAPDIRFSIGEIAAKADAAIGADPAQQGVGEKSECAIVRCVFDRLRAQLQSDTQGLRDDVAARQVRTLLGFGQAAVVVLQTKHACQQFGDMFCALWPGKQHAFGEVERRMQHFEGERGGVRHITIDQLLARGRQLRRQFGVAPGEKHARARLDLERTAERRPSRGQGGASVEKARGANFTVGAGKLVELFDQPSNDVMRQLDQMRLRRSAQAAQQHREVEKKHRVVAPVFRVVGQVSARSCQRSAIELARGPVRGTRGGNGKIVTRPVGVHFRKPVQVIARDLRIDIAGAPSAVHRSGDGAGMDAITQLHLRRKQPGADARCCRARSPRQSAVPIVPRRNHCIQRQF
jgi:hypothetical protein